MFVQIFCIYNYINVKFKSQLPIIKRTSDGMMDPSQKILNKEHTKAVEGCAG